MSDEEEEFEMPITPMDALFIELNQEMRGAVDAGFTEEQAFDLIRILFKSRFNAILFNEDYEAEKEQDE